MAQVRAADRAGTGDHNFVAALAKTFAGEFVVRPARVARLRGDLRGAATALVQRLLSDFPVVGILFQPVRRMLRAGGIFCFYPDAVGIHAAIDGQRPIATQTPAQRGDSLA